MFIMLEWIDQTNVSILSSKLRFCLQRKILGHDQGTIGITNVALKTVYSVQVYKG